MLKKIPYSLEPGDKIGPYEVLEVLGAGGFSIVYHVKNPAGDSFAAKEYMPAGLVVRAANSKNVELISESGRGIFEYGMARLEKEASLLGGLHHPSILRFIGWLNENNTAYLISEFCKGKTLKQHVLEHPEKYNENEIKRIIFPVLEAVEELHLKNVLHRDIAPDNIIIRENGTPVLIDLGSVLDKTEAVVAAEETIVLKPGYAPLEQYGGAGLEGEGVWSDIYSIGALLYFLVVKRAPVASISRAIKDTHVKLDRASYPEFSGEFLDLINRCLEMEILKRPQELIELKDIITPDQTIFYSPLTLSIDKVEEDGSENSFIQEVVGTDTGWLGIIKSQFNRIFQGNPLRNKKIVFLLLPVVIAGLSYFLIDKWIKSPWSESAAKKTEFDPKDQQVQAGQAGQAGNGDSYSRLKSGQQEVNQTEQQSPGTDSFERFIIGTVPASPREESVKAIKEQELILIENDGVEYKKNDETINAALGLNGVTSLAEPGGAKEEQHGGDAAALVKESSSTDSGEGTKGLAAGSSMKKPIEQDKQAVAEARKLQSTALAKNSQKKKEKAVGQVRISIVPWGEVIVNAKNYGVSPPIKVLELPEGNHEIELKNSGFESFYTTVNVVEGQVVNIRHQF